MWRVSGKLVGDHGVNHGPGELAKQRGTDIQGIGE
jgi:hypothetical protein